MKCLLIEEGIIPGFNIQPVTHTGGYRFSVHTNALMCTYITSMYKNADIHAQKKITCFNAKCITCASERARLFVRIRRSAETSHQPLEPPADYQGRWKENTTAKPPINGHLANSYRGRISPCFSHHTLPSRRHLPLILTTALPPLRVWPATRGFCNAWSIEC